jgi:hypothetical protein
VNCAVRLVTVGVNYLGRFARKLVDKLRGGEWKRQSGASALHFNLQGHVSVGSRLRKHCADHSQRTL